MISFQQASVTDGYWLWRPVNIVLAVCAVLRVACS